MDTPQHRLHAWLGHRLVGTGQARLEQRNGRVRPVQGATVACLEQLHRIALQSGCRILIRGGTARPSPVSSGRFHGDHCSKLELNNR